MQFTTATLAILLLAFAAVVRANSYSPSGCSRALITKMDEQSNTHLWTCTDYHREDCFDAATLVWRRNGTSLPMRDLSVGDEILDGGIAHHLAHAIEGDGELLEAGEGGTEHPGHPPGQADSRRRATDPAPGRRGR